MSYPDREQLDKVVNLYKAPNASESAKNQALEWMLQYVDRLIVSLIQKHAWQLNEADQEEIKTRCIEEVWRALEAFDPTIQIAFTSFLYPRLEGWIVDIAKKLRNKGISIKQQNPFGKEEDKLPYGMIQKEELPKVDLDKALKLLSSDERLAIELYYGLKDGVERNQQEVALGLNVTQGYVNRLLKQAIEKLKSWNFDREGKLNWFRKAMDVNFDSNYELSLDEFAAKLQERIQAEPAIWQGKHVPAHILKGQLHMVLDPEQYEPFTVAKLEVNIVPPWVCVGALIEGTQGGRQYISIATTGQNKPTLLLVDQFMDYLRRLFV